MTNTLLTKAPCPTRVGRIDRRNRPWLFYWTLLIFALGPGFTLSASFTADDGLLTAYELTAQQEEKFSETDGLKSAFWRTWGTDNAAASVLDSIGLRVSNGGWPPRYEIVMSAKAAYGVNGLYLCFAVSDDRWEPVTSARCAAQVPDSVRLGDAVAVHLDKRSSADIYGADPVEIFCRPQDWSVTRTSRHIHVPCGDSADPVFVIFQCDSSSEALLCATDSVGAPRATGDEIGVDIIADASGNYIQEWFIPWAKVGMSGFETKPPEGTLIAFTCSYHDRDGDTLISTHWQNRVDPYDGPNGPLVWGDIQFGPSLNSILTTRPARRTNIRERPATGGRLYDVKGRLIGISSHARRLCFIPPGVYIHGGPRGGMDAHMVIGP